MRRQSLGRLEVRAEREPGTSSVVRPTIVWRLGTVHELIDETPRAKTIVLDVAGWPGHIAGQHVDVRLTAEDGYQTERSYSIASAPEYPILALTVERIDGGEVSPYLTEELLVGDQLELRGPMGGFTWRDSDGGPLLLIAGGVGLVPLMAMLRHRAARSSTIEARLLVSARSLEELLYRDELVRLVHSDGIAFHHTFTSDPPPGWAGFARPVDAEMLRAVGPTPARRPRVFVCGPTSFVGRAISALIEIGHDVATIQAEDFGPAGG
jgi:ferredoxin-NADP reductase